MFSKVVRGEGDLRKGLAFIEKVAKELMEHESPEVLHGIALRFEEEFLDESDEHFEQGKRILDKYKGKQKIVVTDANTLHEHAQRSHQLLAVYNGYAYMLDCANRKDAAQSIYDECNGRPVLFSQKRGEGNFNIQSRTYSPVTQESHGENTLDRIADGAESLIAAFKDIIKKLQSWK